jgi:hypothetical protein
MKARAGVAWLAVVSTCLFIDGSALARDAAAKDEHGDKGCTSASLHGSYGFYRTGSTSAGPLAALGSLTFDGKGNLTGSQSVSRNGVFTFDLPIVGPYVVNEDCTGKFLAPDGVTEVARVVVTDRGSGFYIMSESAGNAVYGVGRRISTPDEDDD